MDSEDRLTESRGDTFIEKAQALSEARWKLYCRLGGGLLGLVGGIAICVVPGSGDFGTYKFIAVALALLMLPRYVENQAQRDVTPGRMAMVIAFAVVLALTTAYGVLTGKFA